MKNVISWIVLVFVCTVLQNCQKEGESITPQKVQFTCNLPAASNSGGRMKSPAAPTALLLSLETSAHVNVFTGKVIKLYTIGDSFMTEPIELLPGEYNVTAFFLMNDTGEIFYATPNTGSFLASIVSHPLPFGFAVTKDGVSNVDMEVVDVYGHTVEDFGYGSFGIHVVNPLGISVFTTQGDDIALASATAYIINGADTIQRFDLNASSNLVPFTGNPLLPYKLVVAKDGYNPYHNEFIYNDLVATLGGMPLKIILIPAFTMRAFITENSTPFFEFILHSPPGTHVNVNWGDGNHNDYTFTAPTSPGDPASIVFQHPYASTGSYPVTITGDIDRITFYYSFYGFGAIDALDLQSLTELVEIRIGLTHGPAVIDLSHNKKLEQVMVLGIDQLEHLILPVENVIRAVEISGPQAPGPGHLPASDVDDIVNKVYRTVVLHGTESGGFNYSIDWTRPGNGMLGPPSASSLIKLRSLRDTYHWTVLPDPGI